MFVPGAEGTLPEPIEWIGRERVSVERVASPAEAGERLRTAEVDVILCDLFPDEEAGLDLLRKIRARGDATPCVLIAPERVFESVFRRARMLGQAQCLVRDRFSADELERALSLGCKPRRAARKVDLAPAMLWKTDAEGRFIHFNQRWCRFTGRSEEKECGTGWLDAVHPADVDAWVQVYSTALVSRREFCIDLRVCPENGEFRWIRCHGLPNRSAEGAFLGYLGSSFEVTDLKQAQADALERAERLSQLNRELDSFLQAAFHDLQEPLRTLGSDLKTLEGVHAARARANVGRMQELSRGLLECMQVATRGEPLEPTDLGVPLEWALANLRGLIEENDAQVTFDPLPVVKADAVQMARLFQNLLENAIRCKREAPVLVHVGVARSEDSWRLWVQDNGVGIPREHRERIFEPFQRLTGSPGGGRGLGLTIVRRIVARHGGRIWLESEVGRGSTFYVSLPG